MVPTLAALLVCPVTLDPHSASLADAERHASVEIVLASPVRAKFCGTLDGRDLYCLARPDDPIDAPEWTLVVAKGADPTKLANARGRVRILRGLPDRDYSDYVEVRIELLPW